MAGLALFERDDERQIVGRLDLTGDQDQVFRQASFALYLARCCGSDIELESIDRPSGCGTDETCFTIQYASDTAYKGALGVIERHFNGGRIASSVDVFMRRHIGGGHEVRKLLKHMQSLPPAL